MPHKPSNRASNNVSSNQNQNSMGYSPTQYPHAPYPNYMHGQGPPPGPGGNPHAVPGYAPLNYPSHPHPHGHPPPHPHPQAPPGYPMSHQPYYNNNPNPNTYPQASTIPNHGNPNTNINSNSNNNPNTNINTNKKMKTSHQADEEAAASALLMSAGGKPREQKDIQNNSQNQTQMNKPQQQQQQQQQNESRQDHRGKPMGHTRNDSTGGKPIAEVFHVSPLSNGGSTTEEHGGGDHDHDSIQGELRRTNSNATASTTTGGTGPNSGTNTSTSASTSAAAAIIDDFPTRLHKLLSCGDFSTVAHWMPDGKSWRVVNWHEFSNAMPKYFPKFCENDRGENASVVNRMNSFLNEVQAWGFEKSRDDAGVVCYSNEFFIEIAQNLCKYMKPGSGSSRRKSSSKAGNILSPPRIGRFPQQTTGPGMDSIFCGKRNADHLTNDADEGVVSVSSLRGDTFSASKLRNASSPSDMFSSVTPSFTLTNQVSPCSPVVARGRLQSNRGRSRRPGAPAIPVPQHISYPVSKRGRGRRGVSSRGGRVGNDGLGIPRKLDLSPEFRTPTLPPRANS